MNTPEQDWGMEWEEMQPHDSCPSCGRDYDDIDYDYQTCSKCGWDAANKLFDSKSKREPDEDDYLNGDADILTGQWY